MQKRSHDSPGNEHFRAPPPRIVPSPVHWCSDWLIMKACRIAAFPLLYVSNPGMLWSLCSVLFWDLYCCTHTVGQGMKCILLVCFALPQTQIFHAPLNVSTFQFLTLYEKKKSFGPCNRCQPRNGLNLHTFLIQRYRIDVVCEREHEPKQCQFSLWWKTERPIGAHHVILQQYLEKQQKP